MCSSGFRRRTSCSALVFLLFIAASSSFASADVLSSISGALGAAANATLNVTTTLTSTLGSSLSSAASSANNSLQTATAAVATGLNATVNTTQRAAQSVAAAGAETAAAVVNSTGLAAGVGGPIAAQIEAAVRNGVRHPIVFWPGFGTSRLRVDVDMQTLEPDCPQSGSFHVAFGNPSLLEGWPERCIYKLLEIRYNGSAADPAAAFSSQPGVNVTIADFGSQLCAPIPYEPTFLLLEAVGYTEGHDFFVACYDWRVTPFIDVASDEPHLARAREAIEAAHANTGLPAYLMAHSNGGLQALALLNSSTPEWRSKYIAGLIGLAGNWAGQGALYEPIFTGTSLFDSSIYPQSARAWESWPATYMSVSDPKIYNGSETVIRATVNGTSKNYTSADYDALFRDANLTLARQLGRQLVGNLSAKTAAPGTHFYGFYGSGKQTLVGVTLPSLQQGEVPVDGGNIYALGDDNQEATDNLSPVLWNTTQSSCYHFELNERPGLGHLELPLSPSVLYRVINILFTAPRNCSGQTAEAVSG